MYGVLTLRVAGALRRYPVRSTDGLLEVMRPTADGHAWTWRKVPASQGGRVEWREATA